MAASLNLYSSRVHFTKQQMLYQFLGESGLDEEVLIQLIRNKTPGLPDGVTEESVRKYWRNIGPDITKLTSSITKQRVIERDYKYKIEDLLPNQSITLDVFEGKFSKNKGTKKARAVTVPALNGDLIVIIAVCNKSGSVRYFTIKSLKDPEYIIEKIIQSYGGTLLELYADKVFITTESELLCKKYKVDTHMFVPGSHNIYGGRVEGIGRWVKEGAQHCYNRILALIDLKDFELSEVQPLWRHCWIYSCQVINLRPCVHDASIMRFLYAYGRNFSLINDVMMPFMTKVVIHPLTAGPTGRGVTAYYLCRSVRAGTGILVWNRATKATSIVAPFKVYTHEHNQGSPEELSQIAQDLHGTFKTLDLLPYEETADATPYVIGRTTLSQGGGTPTTVNAVPPGGGVISNGVTAERQSTEDIPEDQDTTAQSTLSRQLRKIEIRDQKQATLDRINSKIAQDKINSDIVKSLSHQARAEARQLVKDKERAELLKKEEEDLASTRASIPGQSTTIEAASNKFRDRIDAIRMDRLTRPNGTCHNTRSRVIADKRNTFVGMIGEYHKDAIDDFEAETNDLIAMAVRTAQLEYSLIMDVHLSGVESLDVNIDIMKKLSPVFVTDPNGEKAAEDRKVMAAFSAERIACIIREEIQCSEDVIYFEDLVEDISKKETQIDSSDDEKDDPLKRPPKPDIPIGRLRKTMPKWIAALRREVDKLVAYDVLQELPQTSTGEYIRPKNAIVQRLIEVAEYKWKTLPDTQVKGWLECIRIVVDGSRDTRPNVFYALTPDRTCLFVILAICATLGHQTINSDVERAYLNALSIDKNLVVIAAPHMFPIALESLLIKALYGSKAGALGWEIHIDAIMESIGYEKCLIARGVYLKYCDGVIVRCYRHSDDLFLTCEDHELQQAEGALIKTKIGMSPWESPAVFLGLEIERRHHITGEIDECGKLILLRQTAKIEEAAKIFAPALSKYFPNSRRSVSGPIPLDHNKDITLVSPLLARLCTPTEITLYQQVVGTIIWIQASTKRNISFATFTVASAVSGATIRDLFNALYLLKYIIQEKDTPLILGGAGPVEFTGTCDCSLGTGRNGKSILSYEATLNEMAGAVASFTQATHFALTNIMHGELESMIKLTHLLIYIRNVVNELGFIPWILQPAVTVRGDNQAALNFVKGGPTSNLSRHFCQRIMAVRNYAENNEAEYEHVPTKDNTSDAGTKAMGPSLFGIHSRNIMGHRLADVLPIKIRGVKSLEEVTTADSALEEAVYLIETDCLEDEINWTLNDLALSHAFTMGMIDTLVEEQPLLIILQEDGTIPNLGFPQL